MKYKHILTAVLWFFLGAAKYFLIPTDNYHFNEITIWFRDIISIQNVLILPRSAHKFNYQWKFLNGKSPE